MNTKRYKRYMLIILMLILAFNYVDRLALGLVIDDIKADLRLSDGQLGFLSGIAFALFYAVMGVPIARWADRGNRVTIIGVTTALWSVAVSLCGMTASFVQLMFVRVVVGVGEAGCVPPAHSLIADVFPRPERPRATALYMQGISLSLVFGYLAAGWLNEFYGWRTMFVMIGLPGIVLAVWAAWALSEPRRATGATPPSRKKDPTVREVCRALWASATFRHVLSSFAVTAFFNYGTLQWTPAFFQRSFGLKSGELGTWFAVIYGFGQLLGTYWGGAWAARYAANNETLQLRASAVASYAFAVLAALVYVPAVAPNYYWAFGWLALYTVLCSAVNGPLMAVIQTLVPPRMRAMSIAMVYFFVNLIGVGLGPWVAGLLSDFLRPLFGNESLRYAMLFLCPGYLWGAWHLWQAANTVRDEVESTQADGVEAGLIYE